MRSTSNQLIELNSIEPIRSGEMDDLPILPFKKVLSYLSLRDRLKSRAVSRRWCQMVDSFKVERLCFSEEPIDRILYKNQVVCGAFVQNFISSPGFDGFFKTFGRSIFSHLKHLRLYGIDLQAGSRTAFTHTLNSFVYLEELGLIYKWTSRKDEKRRVLKLDLPMLKSLQFEEVRAIEKLTLNAPILRKVKLIKCTLNLDLVHGESVELLFVVWNLSLVKLESLRNLQQLYVGFRTKIEDIPLLLGLNQLKEIHLAYDHLYDSNSTRKLFEQKQRHGRTDLKIYRFGCLLDGPGDPAMHLGNFTEVNFPYLAVNPSRLANEIPLRNCLVYRAIEGLAPELQAIFLKRLTDLNMVHVDREVEDVASFLNFLKTFDHITSLVLANQRQDLFNRLPDFPVQELNLIFKPFDFDFEFLLKLKNLMMLYIQFEIGTELILRALEEFKLLEFFSVSLSKIVEIFIENPKPFTKSSKLFKVHIRGKRLETQNLSDVMQFIEQNVIEEQ